MYLNRLCVLYHLSACEVDAINVEPHASGSSGSTSMTARSEQNTECCSFPNGQLLRIASWEIEPGLILFQILQETECHTTTGRPFQQWTTTTIRITSGGVALCCTGVAVGGTGIATPLIWTEYTEQTIWPAWPGTSGRVISRAWPKSQCCSGMGGRLMGLETNSFSFKNFLPQTVMQYFFLSPLFVEAATFVVIYAFHKSQLILHFRRAILFLA